MTKREKLLCLLALAGIALLTLIPFFKVGFTNGDDLEYFITSHQSLRGWLNDATIYAQNAGRFYFLITKYFYYIPYLADNFAVTKTIQYGSLLACYVYAAYIVWRLFKSQNLSLIVLLVLIANTHLHPNNHVPTYAYPFYFTLSLAIFLSGILLYINYTERGKYWRILASAALFFFAYLFYENYLVFAIIFCAAIIVTHWQRDGLKNTLRNGKLYLNLTPYTIGAIAYVACYFGYRQHVLSLHPDIIWYDGASFSDSFSLKNFFNILKNCTNLAVPGIYHSRTLAEHSLQFAGQPRGMLYPLISSSTGVYLNAIVQSILLWWLTRKNYWQQLTGKRLITGAIFTTIAMFMAHSLIGISKKYNQDYFWMTGYVTSFYSYFCIAALIAIAITAALKYSQNKPKIQLAIRVLLCAATLIISTVSNYHNENMARIWSHYQRQFEAIDHLANNSAFEQMPDNAIHYTESLHNNTIFNRNNSFENYIELRIGHNFRHIAKSPEQLRDLQVQHPNAPVYHWFLSQTNRLGEVLLTITHNSDSTARADVFYYSPHKQFVLFYTDNNTICSVNVEAGQNTALPHIGLRGKHIAPESFSVSNLPMCTADTLRIP